ncbi:MAG: transporter substrate-binding protein [Paenibacillaceae bacterium]|nr:transporter substrate-binding protein [Paenibacillaceae bacterium]
MKKWKRISSMVLAVALAGSALAGCSGGDSGKEGSEAGVSPSIVPQQSGNKPEEGVYPIKGNVKLKVWMTVSPNTTAIAKNLGETEFAKEWSKRTGVEVEYIHPAAGQEKEQFNLMLASNNLPDIIEYNWKTSYPGGPGKAIEDKVIVSLNELQGKYAPNLTEYVKQHPDINKLLKSDKGDYYSFPFIREDLSLRLSAGPIIRKDWLDELGLDVPVTIDDWYNVLKAFKEKKGATAPLSPYLKLHAWGLENGAFSGAYGLIKGLYIDGEKVKYGPVEPQYKELLTTLNKWFKEKLLDNNFATIDGKTVDTNIMEGKSGATLASSSSGLAKWNEVMKGKDPKFELIGVPYPSLEKGKPSIYGHYEHAFSGWGMAISATSKNKEAAAQFLDYLYSAEGQMLANFGIEGVSYKMDNGKPIFTDEVLNNPGKLPVAQAKAKYTIAHHMGPFVQHPDVRQTNTSAQNAALEEWKNTEAATHALPPFVLSTAEQSQVSKIMNEVKVYVDEMLLKFIMGSEPLDNFDKYITQLQKLGIGEVIKLNQAALDNYNKN